MPSSLPLGGTNVLIGGALLFVGYLIKYRQWTWLISESTALMSPDGETALLTGSIIGNVTIVVGGTLLLVGTVQVLGLIGPLPDWILLLLLVGTTILVAPRLSYNLAPE